MSLWRPLIECLQEIPDYLEGKFREWADDLSGRGINSDD